jgi:FkbM family methyltransferase
MRIAFLLPRIELAGGIFIVLEHARRLAGSHGHDVTIVTTEDDVVSHAFPSLSDLACVGIDDAAGQDFDVAVATWWHTAYSLPRLVAPRYAQFIQNLEDRFYTASEIVARSGAAAVQTLPLAYITTAGWLERQMRLLRPDAPVYCVRTGMDKTVFRPPEGSASATDAPLRVAIEGPFDVWFKGVGDALASVRRMQEPHHLTVMAGDRQPVDEILELADDVRGRLSHAEVADVLRDVDVLLKLSRLEGMAGPPLEAFHCGATAVMAPVTGHDEYAQHGVNCMLVGYDDVVGTARMLDLLARDRPLLKELRAGALATAHAWPDWEESTALLDAVIEDICRAPVFVDPGYARELISETYLIYLRQWTLAERVESATRPDVIRRAFWVWRHEGARGVAVRIARRSALARKLLFAVRQIYPGFGRAPSPAETLESTETRVPAIAESASVPTAALLDAEPMDAGAPTEPDGEVRGSAMADESLDDESRLIFLHEYMPRAGDVVVDAGAGNGMEVVTFSRLVGPSGRVIAIEAHPDSFAALRLLCARNGLRNVELINAALASESGIVRISDHDDPLLNATVGNMQRGIPVPATTLDEIFVRRGINHADFLKMNIEGAEVDALRGSVRSIKKTRHVCIGCHDFLAEDGRGGVEMRTKEAVREFLERAGFAVTSQMHELPWISDYVYGERSS